MMPLTRDKMIPLDRKHYQWPAGVPATGWSDSRACFCGIYIAHCIEVGNNVSHGCRRRQRRCLLVLRLSASETRLQRQTVE